MKRLLFFGFILLLLASYIYKVQLPAEEERRQAKLWLAGAVPREIEEISIKHENNTVILKNTAPVKYSSNEKKGDVSVNVDTWRLSDLPDAKLDAGAINSIVSTLTNLNLENPIPADERESDLAIYGLDKPSIEISIRDRKLLVGKESEYSGIRYLKAADSDEIYTAKSFAYETLTKNAADLRNRTPVQFQDSDIQSFTVQSKDSTITLENAAEAGWRIVVPLAAKASSSAVSEYLNLLRNLRVKLFFDGGNKKDVAKDISIALTFKDQKKYPKPLVINVSKDHFSIDGDSSSYSMDGDKSAQLAKSVTDLREKKFLSLDTEKTTELVAEFSDGDKYNLHKNNNVWKLDQQDADAAFAMDLLVALSELEASDFATEKERALVEPTELKYTFNNKTLSISKQHSFKNEKVRFVLYADDPTVYVINEDKYKRIAKRRESLAKAAEAN